MKKYKVIIEGHNFLVKIGDETKKRGFYTTRFVEAQDTDEAENIAIGMLRADADLIALTRNEESDSPVMYVEEVEELTSFGDFTVPGSGFAWYPEEKGH